jgi:hypothetical protein
MPVAVVGGFLPLIAKASSDFSTGGLAGLQNTVSCIIPFNPATRKFSTANLQYGLIPILLGFIVHKLASAFGVNRALSAARVPFIRI